MENGANKLVVKVSISDDDMQAFACVTGSDAPGEISQAELIEELKQYGVVFGVDATALEDVRIKPGNTFAVAKGLLPVDGKDSEYIMKYEVSEDKGRPKETAGGRVDYKNLDLFTAVMENDIIAEKIMPSKGTHGSTVKGKLLKARDGRERRMVIGKNIALEENILRSKISGHLIVGRDKIEVLPVLELKADIDLSTGNIDFPGNVLVKGSIQAGFIVKAGGNVQIQGSVFGGTVEAQNIEVKHGIQGANHAYLKARDSVIAKFMENAEVMAGENISVSDAILHSKVSAGKKVTATGGKGIIAGGHVAAGEEIDAKTIGTHMAPPTVIEVGINPMMKEEFLTLRNEYKNAAEMFDSTQKSMHLIKPTEDAIVPSARIELYRKLTNTHEALSTRVKEIKERLYDLESEFDKAKDGKIKCSGYVYPGVKLVINNIVYPVRDNMQFSLFFVSGGEIKFSPYS